MSISTKPNLARFLKTTNTFIKIICASELTDYLSHPGIAFFLEEFQGNVLT
jgi:hypothetical protein